MTATPPIDPPKFQQRETREARSGLSVAMVALFAAIVLGVVGSIAYLIPRGSLTSATTIVQPPPPRIVVRGEFRALSAGKASLPQEWNCPPSTDRANGRTLTFLDWHRNVVATTTTGSGTLIVGGQECLWAAAYSIVLPQSASYQVIVTGESATRPPISIAELRATNLYYLLYSA
jgi:hypothetical protein